MKSMRNYMNSLQNKIASLIQFAYAARKLCFGESAIVKMMVNKVDILVLASDIAQNQDKKYRQKAAYYQVPTVTVFSKSELGELFSKNEVVCVGVMDHNIASQIKKLSEDNQ